MLFRWGLLSSAAKIPDSSASCNSHCHSEFYVTCIYLFYTSLTHESYTAVDQVSFVVLKRATFALFTAARLMNPVHYRIAAVAFSVSCCFRFTSVCTYQAINIGKHLIKSNDKARTLCITSSLGFQLFRHGISSIVIMPLHCVPAQAC